MNDGIYHVTFSSNGGDFGEGIAVFKDGSVNGGDGGYLYTGTKSEQGAQFASRLTVKRWNASAQSIFGPLGEFQLELNGSSPDGRGFMASGYVVGQPASKISVQGKYLAPAA